jgi:hypothetical protein
LAFEANRGLVRLNLADDVAYFDFVSLFLAPWDDVALGHRGGERRHFKFNHWWEISHKVYLPLLVVIVIELLSDESERHLSIYCLW